MEIQELTFRGGLFVYLTMKVLPVGPRKAVILLMLALLWRSGAVIGAQPPFRFAVVGDFGDDSRAERRVAEMIKSWAPNFIVTTGDNTYGDAPIDRNVGKYYSDYIGSYKGEYGSGSMINRFFPTIGNHDYTDGGGVEAYLEYFTLPGDGVVSSNTSGNERYYDFVIGPVHFFAINSDIQEPDSTTATSRQAAWLRAQMAASTTSFQVVVLHHPPYTSSKYGPAHQLRWPFEKWGAEAVFGGHHHLYERLMRDDDADGDSLVHVICGLGGASISPFRSGCGVEGSVLRYNDDYGAMLVDATDSVMTLRFYSVGGKPSGKLIDSLQIWP